MLPFSIDLKLGLPVTEQILFAVKKAVVTGQLRPGDKFPSTRALSEELRINPNTAQKVVTALVAEGVLLTTPAKGSVVAEPVHPARRESLAQLAEDLERLAVEARKLGLEEDDVHDALSAHWRKLDAAGRQHSTR
ncbi:MAG TPA: GntR family transcriptional regulator [Opitutaceae bacterium]|nr:GntR family transcriptional regulator [Opitutaceae bacterium]